MRAHDKGGRKEQQPVGIRLAGKRGLERQIASGGEAPQPHRPRFPVGARSQLIEIPPQHGSLFIHDAPPVVSRRSCHIFGHGSAAGKEHCAHQPSGSRKVLRLVNKGPRRIA